MTLKKVIKGSLLASVVASSLNVSAAVTASEAEAQPENVDLNRTFAQEQFAAGNLADALVGIERVIIASPLDLSARFFRINLMVLLNRGSEVVGELETILTLSLPEADLQRARDLLVRIEKANAKLNMQVRFKAGIEYIDNANSWTDQQATADASVFTDRVDNVNQVGVADPKQLDDVGFVTSLSANGTYGLSDDKATALKFSGLAQTKEYVDTLNKEATTLSGSLGLQHRVDSTTVEVGASLASIDRVNYTKAASKVAVNTDSDITTAYFNLNQRLKTVSVNYKFAETDIENDGFDDPADAKQYDFTSTSHAIRVLAPVRKGLLVQGGLTYAEARNADQTAGVTAARNGTDSDTTTLSGAAFQTLANGDSLVTRVSYADSEALYKLSTKPRIKETDTLTVSLEYRADLNRLVPGMEGWTLGAGVKSVMADSNIVDYEKDTNTVNAFIERKWDIWK